MFKRTEFEEMKPLNNFNPERTEKGTKIFISHVKRVEEYILVITEHRLLRHYVYSNHHYFFTLETSFKSQRENNLFQSLSFIWNLNRLIYIEKFSSIVKIFNIQKIFIEFVNLETNDAFNVFGQNLNSCLNSNQLFFWNLNNVSISIN